MRRRTLETRLRDRKRHTICHTESNISTAYIVHLFIALKVCLLLSCAVKWFNSTVPSSAVLSETPSVSSTAINITGSVPSGTVVTEFVVRWWRDTSVGCSDENHASISETGDFPNSYQISGLQPGNRYTMKVRLTSRYDILSNSITATTLETGESVKATPVLMVIVSLHSSQCWSSLTLTCYCHFQQHHSPVGGGTLSPS